jgi:indoleamine 2,3-dioxygenase
MVQVYEACEHQDGLGSVCKDIIKLVYVQRKTLRKEIEKHCRERNVATSII